MNNIMLSSVFLVVFVAGGCLAADCYSCNYASTKGDVYENWLIDYLEDCGQPFKEDNISTVSCKNDCYKAVVDVPDDDLMCIARGCFPTKTCDDSDTGKFFVLECDGKAYQTEVYCCSEGKCNGASTAKIGLLMMLALLCAYFLF